MCLSRIGSRELLAGVVVLLSFVTAPLRAEGDDAQLRKRALALNDVTGNQTIKGKVQSLVEDAANTKKLLACAAKMVKEAKVKEQPFNYNGAYILAYTAKKLKNMADSERFYPIC